MPKKQAKETQAEQSERFRNDVRRMIDAGELNPTEADEAFEQIFAKGSLLRASNKID
jgi:hypothetical protein